MDDKEYFPFEKYIASTCIQEYNKDIRRKNYIQKYINIIVIDNMDSISLNKLTQNLIFFRNVFCSECILNYCNNFLKEEESQLMAPIFFDMFVVSEQKNICEYKDFYNEASLLIQKIDRKHIINTVWEEIKNNQDII